MFNYCNFAVGYLFWRVVMEGITEDNLQAEEVVSVGHSVIALQRQLAELEIRLVDEKLTTSLLLDAIQKRLREIESTLLTGA
jgi:hypothetical protein